jgi:rhamnosyltransferase
VIFNIKTYAPFLEKLYIIDNSEKKNTQLIRELEKKISFQYIFHNGNKGISYSLNEVLHLSEGTYDWLLTMDQDSRFLANTFESYIANLENLDVNVYGICPIFNDYNNKLENYHHGILHIKESCITSGNIIRVRLAIKCGGFDENLFIDEVDHEFCYRCNKWGYRLLEYQRHILQHDLGEPIYKNIFGFKFRTLNEGYIRQYYIFRNRLYVAQKYPEKKLMYYKKIIKWMIKIIIAEPDKFKKIKYAYLGYRDFRNGKYGKFSL